MGLMLAHDNDNGHRPADQRYMMQRMSDADLFALRKARGFTSAIVARLR
jgi:hypothetical protein